MRGNRYYLTSRNVEHHQFPFKKGIQRIQNQFAIYYFEPTADGTGVKVTYITLVPSSEDGYTDTLQSFANLTHFLRQQEGRDDANANAKDNPIEPRHRADSEATSEKEELKEEESGLNEESKLDDEQDEEHAKFDIDPNSHLDERREPTEEATTENTAEQAATAEAEAEKSHSDE